MIPPTTSKFLSTTPERESWTIQWQISKNIVQDLNSMKANLVSTEWKTATELKNRIMPIKNQNWAFKITFLFNSLCLATSKIQLCLTDLNTTWLRYKRNDHIRKIRICCKSRSQKQKVNWFKPTLRVLIGWSTSKWTKNHHLKEGSFSPKLKMNF